VRKRFVDGEIGRNLAALARRARRASEGASGSGGGRSSEVQRATHATTGQFGRGRNRALEPGSAITTDALVTLSSGPRGYLALQRTIRARFPAMTMNRCRVLWSNWPGAPGYSNFYVGTSITDHTPIRTFFAALTNYVPAAVTWTVPTSGDQISEATGAITGAYTATVTGGSVAGAVGNSGAYPGMAGAVIEWQTSAIIAGRRPLGKTFLVPLYPTAFDANGSILTAAITAIQAAGTTLISALSGELKVWSRPRPALAGANVTVTSCRVPDLAVALRTRRA